MNPAKYRIPIEGRWDLHDLYEFPHTYAQIYSVLYVIEADLPAARQMRRESVFTRYPWGGGYSAVNFYFDLYYTIPAEDRPQIPTNWSKRRHMLLSEFNHKAIQEAVESVYLKAQEVPGLILTEDDLKCHLFLEFSKLPSFSTPAKTQEDDILATPLHTEISWYDKEGFLSIKPDITILSPEHLSILYKRGTQESPPSKQLSFDGHAFIFELKFIRGPQDFNLVKLNEIKNDFQKIKSLFERLESIGVADEVYCYFIIFSRFDRPHSDWNHFVEENAQGPHWHLIYRTLNVPLPNYEVQLP